MAAAHSSVPAVFKSQNTPQCETQAKCIILDLDAFTLLHLAKLLIGILTVYTVGLAALTRLCWAGDQEVGQPHSIWNLGGTRLSDPQETSFPQG